MKWKAAVIAIGLIYFVTWLPAAVATPRSFGRALLNYRLRGMSAADPGYVAPSDRDRVAKAFDVRWVLPIIPGVVLVSHEVGVGGCTVSGLAVTTWWPGHMVILSDFR
jgi:hypothetical protein